MVRSALVVRPATCDDMPVLLEMWTELARARGRLHPRGGQPSTGELDLDTPAVERWYRQAIEDPDQRLLVADVDGAPAGLVLVGLERRSGMAFGTTATVHHLVVAERCRRRGAGGALLAAAAAFAESTGVEMLAVDAPPADRMVNRYYARLGFAPLATRRVAPVALLRRASLPELVGPDLERRRVRLRHTATVAQARLVARRREQPGLGTGR